MDRPTTPAKMRVVANAVALGQQLGGVELFTTAALLY
jgi:hypothetical protein